MRPNSSYFNNIVYNMTLITVNSRGGDESALVFLVAGAWGIAVPHRTENRFAAIKKAPPV